MTIRVEDEHVPIALREVWQWKDAIHEEVKGLSFHDAVRVISDLAHETAVKFGFVPVDSPASRMRVAETHAEYGKK